MKTPRTLLNRRGHTVSVISGMAIGLIASLSTDASAVDVKLFAGAGNCVGNKPHDRDNVSIGGQGVFSESDDTDVTCGAVRDLRTGDVKDAWVRVRNKSSSDPVTCYFHSWNQWGSASNWDSEWGQMTSAGSASIHFEGDNITTHDSGYYTLFCTLHDGDQIYSFRIDED